MSYLFNRKTWRTVVAATILAGFGLGTLSQAVTADDKQPAKPADPYAVPDGKPAELLKFIQRLGLIVVRSLKEHLKKNRAIVAAADKILAAKGVGEKDSIAAYKAKFTAFAAMARFDVKARTQLTKLAAKLKNHKNPEIQSLVEAQSLQERIGKLTTLDNKKREQLLKDLVTHLKNGNIDKLNADTRRRFGMARTFAKTLERSKNKALAVSAYRQLAAVLSKSKNTILKRYSLKMEGSARRINLLGNTIDIKGKTVDGKPFKWSDYKGKVVLVDFWATWCGPCIAELPNVKKMYKLYHDRGFEIVGISLDRSTSKAKLEKFIKDRDVTWTNLFSPDPKASGWDHPMATHYGVTSIPSAILVDQKGKVVSMRARGRELQKLLAKLLGKAEVKLDAGKSKKDK